MRALEFFDRHPVFRHEEFVAAHTADGRSRATSNNLLAKHVASGRLVRIRKGLYATVARGHDAATAPVDPFLVAGRLADDGVIAYHAALQLFGRAYSVWRRFHVVTGQRLRRFSFRGFEVVPVLAPAAVRGLPEFGGGVKTVGHGAGEVRVTSLERALVDVMDAPDRAGGWEEVWRSLEMVEFFDVDAVTEYALRLGSALAVARVGFFLEQHREALVLEDAALRRLRSHAPRQPRYFDSRRTEGRFVAEWNLVVPTAILERSWEEAG